MEPSQNKGNAVERYVRRIVRAELDSLRDDIARQFADVVVQNNEQIERDLIERGVLPRDD